MIVAFAADHAGFSLKQTLLATLTARGVMTLDLGTDSETSVDYPDYAHRLCHLLDGGLSYGCIGVLICGSGIGMSIVANRHRHIRCALSTCVETVRLARMHNDANVLALGARVMDDVTATAILDAFMTTPYEGGRHDKRLAKLNDDLPRTL